jgi:hypothetical protein
MGHSYICALVALIELLLFRELVRVRYNAHFDTIQGKKKEESVGVICSSSTMPKPRSHSDPFLSRQDPILSYYSMVSVHLFGKQRVLTHLTRQDLVRRCHLLYLQRLYLGCCSK